MKVYEKSYHTQEKRLATSLDRIDALMNEKSNLEVAHNDLLQNFEYLRQDKEKLSVENDTIKIEIKELRNQLDHIKLKVINKFDDPKSSGNSFIEPTMNAIEEQHESEDSIKVIEVSDDDEEEEMDINDQ